MSSSPANFSRYPMDFAKNSLDQIQNVGVSDVCGFLHNQMDSKEMINPPQDQESLVSQFAGIHRRKKPSFLAIPMAILPSGRDAPARLDEANPPKGIFQAAPAP